LVYARAIVVLECPEQLVAAIPGIFDIKYDKLPAPACECLNRQCEQNTYHKNS
jgi:hypothetical protein